MREVPPTALPQRLLRGATALLAFVLGAHAFTPPTTWHDLLGYTSGALLFVTLMTGARAVRYAASLFVALTVIAHLVLPIFDFPPPSGTFAVGTADHHFGEIPVVVWYSASSEGPRARYLDSRTSHAIGQALDLPGWFFSHFAAIRTHAMRGVAPAVGRFPVVVFSHGLHLGYPRQNTMLAEHLASTGVVVVAIEHVGSSISTSSLAREGFDDLRLQEPNLDAALNGAETVTEIDAVARRALIERPLVSAFHHEALNRYVADQRAVIDGLGRLDLPIDPTSIIIGGMSFGGYAAMQTCTVDPRCQAGFNLDGAMPGILDIATIPVPFVTLASEANKLARLAPTRVDVIDNTTHLQFSDAARFSHLPTLMGLTDPTPAIQHAVDELLDSL